MEYRNKWSASLTKPRCRQTAISELTPVAGPDAFHTAHSKTWHRSVVNNLSTYIIPLNPCEQVDRHTVYTFRKMNPFCAEKALLLPTVEPTLVISSKTPAEHRRQRIESALLMAALLLTAFQFFVLYPADGNVPAFLDGQCYVLLNRLARGLRISIPASLPTTALIFIFAPYIAEKERVVITRYMALVAYLLGSTLGALLL
jgi:hypothetical protein